MIPVRRSQGYVLSGANLISANLSEADLSGANLSNVIGLSDELIAEAKTLEGATPPSFAYEDEDWLKSKDARKMGRTVAPSFWAWAGRHRIFDPAAALLLAHFRLQVLNFRAWIVTNTTASQKLRRF